MTKWATSHRWITLLRLLAAPVTTAIATPVRMAQSLWSCRVLGDGRWHIYNRFTARNGLNSLFYWTMALNLDRHGRRGVSPNVGLGAFALHRWIGHCLFSIYAYWRLGPVIPLAGMFGWLLAHLIWIDPFPASWVIAAMIVAACSTLFYSNTFVLQNYNALAWAAMPLGVYGLIENNPWIAAAGWLVASFSGTTAVAIGFALSATASMTQLSAIPLLTIVPAAVKLMTHFAAPLSSRGGIFTGLVAQLRAVGISGGQASKYRYDLRGALGITHLFFLVSYAQFVLFMYLQHATIAWLTLAAMMLFVVNSAFLRFADPQSIMMTVLTTTVAETISAGEPLMLIPLWLAISPAPLFLDLPARGRAPIDIVPRYEPFRLDELFALMNEFLSEPRPGERILMAFEDPGDDWSKVFDGYAPFRELPHYVACQRGIHLFPDLWSVTELNHQGAVPIWGRDVASVSRNLAAWSAQYALVYTTNGAELDPAWGKAGFAVVARFSWREHENELRKESFATPLPDWWLLRPPASIHEKPAA
jgi:hypothetical protein